MCIYFDSVSRTKAVHYCMLKERSISLVDPPDGWEGKTLFGLERLLQYKKNTEFWRYCNVIFQQRSRHKGFYTLFR